MKVYTCTDFTDFTGFYPVGCSAIIVAESEEDARRYLVNALKLHRLWPQKSEPELVEFEGFGAKILNDGDY